MFRKLLVYEQRANESNETTKNRKTNLPPFPRQKRIYLNKIVQRLIYHMMTYHFVIKVKSFRCNMHLYVSPKILCFLSKMSSKKLNWYIDMFEKHNDMFFIHMNFNCLDRKMKYMNSNYNKTP